MRPLDQYISKQLNEHLEELSNLIDSDVLTIISPIVHGLDNRVKDAVESNKAKKDTLAVIIDTPGGVVVVDPKNWTVKKALSGVVMRPSCPRVDYNIQNQEYVC